MSRRLAVNSGGASAVEFALIAGSLHDALSVVAESGLVALEQQTLDIALDRGVRSIANGGFSGWLRRQRSG